MPSNVSDSSAEPPRDQPRDHGGDLARAIARHGGTPEDWVDLSTGINAVPYPFAPPNAAAWARLPGAREEAALIEAARAAYRVHPEAAIVAAPGAQALIQLVPRLRPAGSVAIVAPTYNEHAAAFAAEGWAARPVAEPGDAAPGEALVVVNPNNPDGRRWRPDALGAARALTIVDESFADPHPELSLASAPPQLGRIALRSFGKFYGLAGLRLGFAIGDPEDIAHLARMLGPWAVSGPALGVGAAALTDRAWADETIARLNADAARLDQLAANAEWRLVGGAALFRTFETGDARAAQAQLAAHRIWSRIFPYSDSWIRLGLPGSEPDWSRLAEALA